MANAVFVQNPNSIYDDLHGVHYHFPEHYRGMVEETVGDWVIFYEGRAGISAYTHVQRVAQVRADPQRPGHYYADLDEKSYLEFEQPVPRLRHDGTPYETRLPPTGGLNASAVRRLTEVEFSAIINAGLQEIPDTETLPRNIEFPGFAENQYEFEHVPPPVDRRRILTCKQERAATFARIVKRAYGGRCAISGLELRNGGGRPEVEAAHIRPVSDDGPDWVRNGLALSGTIHWMFDRGLISIAPDHRILISHNKVPDDVARRLIVPDQKLTLPANPRYHPHPRYLKFHRERIFGQLS